MLKIKFITKDNAKNLFFIFLVTCFLFLTKIAQSQAQPNNPLYINDSFNRAFFMAFPVYDSLGQNEHTLRTSRHHIIPRPELIRFYNEVVRRDGANNRGELAAFSRILRRLAEDARDHYFDFENSRTFESIFNIIYDHVFDSENENTQDSNIGSLDDGFHDSDRDTYEDILPNLPDNQRVTGEDQRVRALFTIAVSTATRMENGIINGQTPANSISPIDALGLQVLQRLFVWLPGNLLIGPTNRSDEPGSSFETNSYMIIGEQNYNRLQATQRAMNQYVENNDNIDIVLRFFNNIIDGNRDSIRGHHVYDYNHLDWVADPVAPVTYHIRRGGEEGNAPFINAPAVVQQNPAVMNLVYAGILAAVQFYGISIAAHSNLP